MLVLLLPSTFRHLCERERGRKENDTAIKRGILKDFFIFLACGFDSKYATVSIFFCASREFFLRFVGGWSWTMMMTVLMPNLGTPWYFLLSLPCSRDFFFFFLD